ncbi:hypothetical protein M493_02477 [Geobacillus genomosp. 3]|uniref:Uncharacterized protein n=1 Tax=Geobacillus genomosp. 3 TaxID=1921421 RepID=V5LVJ1_GEOG3|nr:hypothetical protein M493_02477 [Geobacillus genomosp. 3]
MFPVFESESVKLEFIGATAEEKTMINMPNKKKMPPLILPPNRPLNIFFPPPSHFF